MVITVFMATFTDVLNAICSSSLQTHFHCFTQKQVLRSYLWTQHLGIHRLCLRVSCDPVHLADWLFGYVPTPRSSVAATIQICLPRKYINLMVQPIGSYQHPSPWTILFQWILIQYFGTAWKFGCTLLFIQPTNPSFCNLLNWIFLEVLYMNAPLARVMQITVLYVLIMSSTIPQGYLAQ